MKNPIKHLKTHLPSGWNYDYSFSVDGKQVHRFIHDGQEIALDVFDPSPDQTYDTEGYHAVLKPLFGPGHKIWIHAIHPGGFPCGEADSIPELVFMSHASWKEAGGLTQNGKRQWTGELKD